MAELSRCSAAAAMIVSMHESCDISLNIFESVGIRFTPDILCGLGWINASFSAPADNLVMIRPSNIRVRQGRKLRYRIASRQPPDSVAAVDFDGVARVLRSLVELVVDGNKTPLAYSVEISVGAICSSVDLVVQVPEDAAWGSEVVLRRVSAAGCDVALDEAPVRVIVGYNHEPVPEGRVFTAARAGDIPALTQALDDGCSTQESTQETGGVGFSVSRHGLTQCVCTV
jgi:hypothetical protein